VKKGVGVMLGVLGLLIFVFAYGQRRSTPPGAMPRARLQPRGIPGSQVVFDNGVDMIPGVIPHLRRSPDFIPEDGFDAMTRVGNVNQPELLMAQGLLALRYQTEPIPEKLVLIPTPNAPPASYQTETEYIWGGQDRR